MRVLAVVLAMLLVLPLGDVPADVFAEVVKVTDGDTIRVVYQGAPYNVRYIGVDTPEVFFAVQCY
jgi:endonuclease YncB( thermonuclease family)